MWLNSIYPFIWDFHSGVNEHSVRLGCNAVLLDKQFPVLQRNSRKTKNSPFKEQVCVLMYENLFFLKKIEVPNIIKHLQPGVTTVSQHWKCEVGK
jgi:hypothetical protein